METNGESKLARHLKGAAKLRRAKSRLGRLRKESRRDEEERSRGVAALGARTFELGIREDAFASAFDRVRDLERKKTELSGNADDLRASIGQKESEKEAIEGDHGARTASVETEFDLGNQQASAAARSRKEGEKVLKQLEARHRSSQKSLEDTRSRLAKAESAPPESPERSRIETLRTEIAQAEGELYQIESQIPSARADLEARVTSEAKCRTVVDQQKERLRSVKEERARAIEPLDRALAELRSRLAENEKHADAVNEQMAGGLSELGARVDAARPANEALGDHYRQIDRVDAGLAASAAEAKALEETIASASVGARLTYYGTIMAAALALIVGGWMAFGSDLRFDLPFFRGPAGEVSVRVADRSSESILGASTVLFFQGGPVAQYTDIHGAATLTLDHSRGRRGRLVVEAEGYRIHEQEIRLDPEGLVEVLLQPPDPETADVIVRALDSSTQEPVKGARIVVHSGGDTFQQVADSNGISKFSLDFYDSKADVEMSVEFQGFEIEHERVTLLPDRVQDVALDRSVQGLSVDVFDASEALLRNFRDVEGSEIGPGTRATGQLRDGTIVDYTFAGHFNTPLLFNVKNVDGELGYSILFYDQEDFLIEESGTHYNEAAKSFTPPESGNYRIRLRGDSRGSGYALTMAYLSGPPDKRNEVFPLSLERSQKGMLGPGAYDDYEIQGKVNTPLIFRLQRSSGELGYELELIDDQGTSLHRHGTFWGGLEHIPFTPPSTSIFIARILSVRGFGSYTVAIDSMRDNPEPSRVELGRGLTGELAVGAANEYFVEGFHNTPLMLTFQLTRGELGYRLEIYDSQNRRLHVYGTFYSGTKMVPFTPQVDDEYRLRVVGERGFGSYVLNANLFAGPSAERNVETPLEIDGSEYGNLAVGAYDDFSFEGQAGRSLTFTTQLSQGELGYSVLIFDAEGKELARHGPFYAGLKSFTLQPAEGGTYRARVYAESGFGQYVITLNEN